MKIFLGILLNERLQEECKIDDSENEAVLRAHST